ncbi:MAG: hypothetical protein UV09_C0001G0070 [Candidatus Gottesmanbacteria bacterium GW2011_GWA2_42_18]|uniref:Uncharacterized protein n=1 Tax=Candidatus Gottesmanbacteria bacterium GW2011_GWA2_42_18 TaxID=1618442 RepID=A0A0G1CEG5_9BACT|nr:MAG: hypothetical protein UV09_C0001G0070 [Candidatus Gottesmanbacteria bacterium GW2011_GWA2_42_18]
MFVYEGIFPALSFFSRHKQKDKFPKFKLNGYLWSLRDY